MKNNKTASSSSKKRRLPRKAGVILILLVLAATLVFIFMSYRAQQVRQQEEAALAADKASFAQVEAEMAKAYDAVVAAAGKPADKKVERGCGRPNLKFSEGNMVCSITYTFVYGEESALSAYEHAQAVGQTFNASSTFSTEFSASADSLDRSSNAQQSVRFEPGKVHDLVCNTHLSFDKTMNGMNSHDSSKQFESLYQFRCSKDVTTAIYPLAQ